MKVLLVLLLILVVPKPVILKVWYITFYLSPGNSNWPSYFLSKIDLIDNFSDLISDLFSADDSYINDTSSSHVASTSNSNAASIFFQTNGETTSDDNKPLLQTDLLKKLIKSLSVIKYKNKGIELINEVEVENIGRLLKILERSWSNKEELIFWDKEATKEKKELMDDGVGKKGKGRAGSIAAGKKGKGKAKVVKRKGSTSKNIDEEEDDSDDGREQSHSPTKSIGGASLTTNGGGGRASRSRSNSPMLPLGGANKSNEMDLDDIEEDSIWTEESLNDFEDALYSLSDAILAIRTTLALLTITDSLPKQFFSSDFITGIFSVLRHGLDGFLFPLLEASNRSHLYELNALNRAGIRSICDSIELVIPLVNTLVHNEEMSEEIVISTVYYSLSPFFHEAAVNSTSLTSNVRGKKAEIGTIEKAMKGIRLASLGLIRTVIGRYPVQRAWIIEEVLSNLTKLEVAKKGKGGFRLVFVFLSISSLLELTEFIFLFRLRNGTSIHTISALILHLVQTSPSDFRGSMKARLTALPKDKLIDIEMREVGDAQEEEDEEDIGKPPLVSNLDCYYAHVNADSRICRKLLFEFY